MLKAQQSAVAQQIHLYMGDIYYDATSYKSWEDSNICLFSRSGIFFVFYNMHFQQR